MNDEQNPETPPAETPPEAPETTDPPNDDVDHDVDRTDDVATLRGEAKKRRLALREVEGERDALRERLDVHDRREVERRAAERLAEPTDVWLASSLDAMRGDDGALDDQKVGAELGRITKERPHWMRPFPEVHQGPRDSVEPEKPSFGATVKKALGGG